MTEHMHNYATHYFDALSRIGQAITASERGDKPVDFDTAIVAFMHQVRKTDAAAGKVMFIGNGGSASIASHMAVDFFKNGGIRAMAFNDPMFLTCLSNDLGYENVFSFQIERQGEARDLLVAISSSGRSANILNGVNAARARGAKVVTMSGFAPDNSLRVLGDLNFYVPSGQYGYVELLHSSLCHCVLDGLMNIPTG